MPTNEKRAGVNGTSFAEEPENAGFADILPQNFPLHKTGPAMNPVDTLNYFYSQGGRFCRPMGYSKDILEKEWPTKPYDLQAIIAHVNAGNNAGLLTGELSANIGLFDLDRKYQAFCEKFPKYATFPTVYRIDANDRAKFFFIVDDSPENISRLKIRKYKPFGEKYPWFEFLWTGRYAIIPPSKHPDTGADYRLKNAGGPIPKITVKEADSIWFWLTGEHLIKQAKKSKKTKPGNTHHDDVKEEIRGKFDLETYAIERIGGEAQAERNGEIRIKGNGGLLVKDKEWYCHSDSIGGDCFDLVGYKLFGNLWNRTDAQMFVEVLHEAGDFVGIDLTQRRNGHSKNGTHVTSQATQPSNPAPITAHASFLLDGGPTDEANAQALVKLYPNKFLNCVQLAKNNQPGWLSYNGKYWTPEQAPQILDRFVVDTIIQRCKAGLDRGIDPTTGKLVEEQLVKFCTPNNGKIQSCKGNLSSLISTGIAEFDNDRDLLNVNNGVVNLKTGELVPHSPGQRFTYCIPVDYDPNADYSFWVTWLCDTVGDLKTLKYLQVAGGYSLTGWTSEECMFYVHGPTRSGKGTFSETLLKLLGSPLAAGVDFAAFTEKRDGDSQNFDLAGLKATRFVVASESNKYQLLNPRRIKAITGGDAIRCAHKHGPFFEYFPMFKVWLFSNEPVKGDSEDDALWARVHAIKFPISHLGKEDKKLKQRMLEPANLQGVLAWLVAGAVEWYANGLQKPQAVINETQAQRDANDFSAKFIKDCITEAPEWFLPNSVWKAVYQGWCNDHNFMPKEAKVTARLNQN